MNCFDLYTEEQSWWSFADHQAVFDVMSQLRARTVLEFGPGSSTLALIEGGATHIDTCEDDREWYGVYEKRLAKRFPRIVCLHLYPWANPVRVPGLDGRWYDLALIDGPRGIDRRPAVLQFALKTCAWALMPTEESNPEAPQFRREIERVSHADGRQVQYLDTGPLSGAFALIGPPC